MKQILIIGKASTLTLGAPGNKMEADAHHLFRPHFTDIIR
jgi:hypothetical protein